MAITQGREPVTDNPLDAMRQAFIEGRDPEAAVYGTSSRPSNPLDSLPEAPAEEVEASPVESAVPNSPAEEPSVTVDADSETVWVKDAKGRKQKLEISYSDREKIKKAYLQMAGMRKFQLERDEERKAKAELAAKHEALSGDWSKLESAYKERGVRGLAELLGGGEKAWTEAVEAELKHREKLASMNPLEKAEYDASLQTRALEAKVAEMEKKHQKALEEIEKTNYQAAERTLQSKLVPSFEKYRFKGKLGDGLGEDKIDKAIWSEVVSNLAEYPDTVELTQSIIDKEFREASSVYKKLLKEQTEKSLKTAVAKKKEDAAQRVQVTVKKGIAAQSTEAEVQDDIANSRWSALFQKIGAGKLKI